ncbi:MAG: tartrate dehydrogenase [Rhodospirillales bacterium]|nr:tartrate dehydrogenase [Rhodospirillales bacterium]
MAGKTKSAHKIAVIPGDGIGKEVVPEGLRVLEAAGRKFGISFDFTHFDWSCENFAKTGRMMPEDGIDELRNFEAIYLGAVGFPGVADHVSLWGLLIPIRRNFRQYVNLRPVRLLKGLDSPLTNRGPADIDMVIVRENVEGEYSEIGGRLNKDTEDELAVQQAVFTRKGCDRIMRYAFELAQRRPKKHVTSATKSNGISISMPYWDERFAAMKKNYADIRTDQYHIDILCSHMVRHPDWFDVVVASNLFGDILSDLAPAVAAGIGIAPGANINPEKTHPSMFEPVHGSAPDIAGKGVANPIGQIWTGAMMLDHLGHPEAGAAVVAAIEKVIAETPLRTADIGGKTKTSEMGKAIADAV